MIFFCFIVLEMRYYSFSFKKFTSGEINKKSSEEFSNIQLSCRTGLALPKEH